MTFSAESHRSAVLVILSALSNAFLKMEL